MHCSAKRSPGPHGGPGDPQDLKLPAYLPPKALTCCALDNIADGIESIGIDLSHLIASFASFEVLSSVNGSVIRLGSGSSMPSAAATALRNASRTIQVWASMLAILK